MNKEVQDSIEYINKYQELAKDAPPTLERNTRGLPSLCFEFNELESARQLSYHYGSTPVEMIGASIHVYDVIDLKELTIFTEYHHKLDPSEYSDDYKNRMKIALRNQLSKQQEQVLELLGIFAKFGITAEKGKQLLEELSTVYTITPKNTD